MYLAGLTKIPIDGQPKSIVRELEDMARSYIKVGMACPVSVLFRDNIWMLQEATQSSGARQQHETNPEVCFEPFYWRSCTEG